MMAWIRFIWDIAALLAFMVFAMGALAAFLQFALIPGSHRREALLRFARWGFIATMIHTAAVEPHDRTGLVVGGSALTLDFLVMAWFSQVTDRTGTIRSRRRRKGSEKMGYVQSRVGISRLLV